MASPRITITGCKQEHHDMLLAVSRHLGVSKSAAARVLWTLGANALQQSPSSGLDVHSGHLVHTMTPSSRLDDAMVCTSSRLDDTTSSLSQREREKSPPQSGGGGARPGGLATPEREKENPPRGTTFGKLLELTTWQRDGLVKLLPADSLKVSGWLSRMRSGKRSPLKRWECAEVGELHKAHRSRAERAQLALPGGQEALGPLDPTDEPHEQLAGDHAAPGEVEPLDWADARRRIAEATARRTEPEPTETKRNDQALEQLRAEAGESE